MAARLTDEPLSTKEPVFLKTIEEVLCNGGFFVVTVRYSRCGGAKSFHLYKDAVQFINDLAKYNPATSLTIHSPASFNFIGPVTDEAEMLAKQQLAAVLQVNKHDDIELILLDTEPGELVDDEHIFADNPQEIEDWCRTNRGRHAAIGQLIFWDANTPETFTAYVPDPDGKVRPGAY